MNRRRAPAPLLLALMAVAFSGCGPPRVTSGGNNLVGAKFEIPVYPGARLVSSGSPTTFHRGDPASPTTYDGLVWKLSYNDPAEKVVSYYEDQLRDAQRVLASPSTDPPPDESDPNPEPTTVALFRYKPQGAVDDEEVTIEIYDRRIEIAQVARVE
ncbi:MAG: hypothetical protein AB7O26_20445 [Planctomycetaceae bacterium]